MWLFLCCTAQFVNFRFCMWYFGALSFSHLYAQAARETGALQAAKNKLEKQVEELTWRLQLEKRMRVSINTTTNLLKVVLSCCIALLIRTCSLVHEFSTRLIYFLELWTLASWRMAKFSIEVFLIAIRGSGEEWNHIISLIVNHRVTNVCYIFFKNLGFLCVCMRSKFSVRTRNSSTGKWVKPKNMWKESIFDAAIYVRISLLNTPNPLPLIFLSSIPNKLPTNCELKREKDTLYAGKSLYLISLLEILKFLWLTSIRTFRCFHLKIVHDFSLYFMELCFSNYYNFGMCNWRMPVFFCL